MNYNEFIKIYNNIKEKSPKKFKVLELFLQGKKDLEIADQTSKKQESVRKDISNLCTDFDIPNVKNSSRRDQLIELFSKHEPTIVHIRPSKSILPEITCDGDIGGVLSIDSQIYLQREDDANLYNTLNSHQGTSSILVKIQGAKNTGKSSLLLRLDDNLKKAEPKHIVAFVDFKKIDDFSQSFNDIDQLFFEFTKVVTKKFIAQVQIDPNNSNGSSQNTIELSELGEYFSSDNSTHADKVRTSQLCNDYLNDLFEKIDRLNLNRPKTIIIDHLEAIFGQNDVQDTFLNWLRDWHEYKMKKVTDKKVIWPHVIVAYSTEPYLKKDMSSPLNVGRDVILKPFDPEQILLQSEKYGLRWTQKSQKPQQNIIFELIQGNPYSTNLILYKISRENQDLDTIINQATLLSDENIFKKHLRELYQKIQADCNLKECLRKLVEKECDSCDDISTLYRLITAGIVKESSENGKKTREISCQLYQKFFQEILQN